jgi:voltage-gated potassium channel
MQIDHLYRILKINMDIVTLAILVALIIIFGGIGVFLAEHRHPGANITNLGDALWWAVVTIATVGYGDYYPVTAVGRVLAVIVMFSGIGIFVLLVGTLSQRRLHQAESRLKSRTETGLLNDGTKTCLMEVKW